MNNQNFLVAQSRQKIDSDPERRAGLWTISLSIPSVPARLRLGEAMALAQGSPDSITVFYSYVNDVKYFVERFSEHFIDITGIIRKLDWLIDPIPPGATLQQELRDKINHADAFIAFVDKTYPNKIAADELCSALAARSDNGRPLLIPILLGTDALHWWRKIKDRAPTAASDIVYREFYKPGTNFIRELTFEDAQQIHQLRDWVIGKLHIPRLTAGEDNPISPPPSSPQQPQFDDASSDPSDARQRVTMALSALDSIEVHIQSARDMLSQIGAFLGANLEAATPAPSMGERTQIDAELRRDGVPSHLRRTFLNIFDRRNRAMKISDLNNRVSTLLLLAEEFHTLIENVHRPTGFLSPKRNSTKDVSHFNYLLNMEEALSRLQTDNTEALVDAIKIYDGLETTYLNKPAIPFRRGWAYYRLEKYDDALVQYANARYLVQELVMNESAATASPQFSDYDLRQMRQRLPRYIGLVYWKISNKNEIAKETEKQLDNLATAYNVASDGLGISNEADIIYHNDLLYYGLKYREVFGGRRTSGTDPAITNEMVTTHLSYLENRVNIEEHQAQEELDTLCYAYEVLKRSDEQALRAATRLQYLLLLAPDRPATLNGLQATAAGRAARIIASAATRSQPGQLETPGFKRRARTSRG
jgi:hypothetical protein